MRPLVGLLLRRQRERSGLSLADAAARLGAKSLSMRMPGTSVAPPYPQSRSSMRCSMLCIS